jgi:GMP synthase (glutamine-hydrolysing)
MRCHIIQHADFETPGVFLPWAKHKGFTLNICHPYRGDSLPEVSKEEPVILMGGPQSARNYAEYPYLVDELRWMRKLLMQDHPFVGVCLGAQLIAECLGAKTDKSPEKEVGTFDLTLTPEGEKHPFLQHIPTIFPVFHWHNDMPGIPNGAQILATSKGCPRQIIEFSPKILGFQCHFEMTPAIAKELVAHASDDLAVSRFTQTKEAILSTDFTQMNLWLFHILDRWHLQL